MPQRIISGGLKGKRLRPVSGRTIRPTGDRQREAIFNILGATVREAKVLDLYAGTGALGIEALSRGAQRATFIDNNSNALDVLEQNIRWCRVETKSKRLRWNILKDLMCLPPLRLTYTLVFMDPPYGKGYIRPTLHNLVQSGCMEKGAVLVVEHDAAEVIPRKKGSYALSDQRRYGKTLVSFLHYMLLFVVFIWNFI